MNPYQSSESEPPVKMIICSNCQGTGRVPDKKQLIKPAIDVFMFLIFCTLLALAGYGLFEFAKSMDWIIETKVNKYIINPKYR